MADTEDFNRDVQQAKTDAANSFGQLKDDAVRVAQSAADLGRQGVEQVKARISDGTAAVRDQLNDHRENVKAKLNDGSEALRDAAYRARARGNDALSQVQARIEEKPLQAVAIAAAAGVVLGVLLRR